MLTKKKLEYSLALLFSIAFVACSTPTISGDDADEENWSSEQESSSSLSSIPDNWSWKVSKEDRMNSEIVYGDMTDERDGKTYKTIQVVDQIWMAENLNFDPGQGGSDEEKYDWSWCFNDVADNCELAGRLYSWAAVMDSVTTGCGYGLSCAPPLPVQGICPGGWHLPRKSDWEALFEAVGGQSTAGKKLKSKTGWEPNSKGADGIDAYGFSALPAGYRNGQGDYKDDGYIAGFWSATEQNYGEAYIMDLANADEGAYLDEKNAKFLGLYVRCVKD